MAAPGQPLPPHGKQLGRLDSADLKQVIQKVGTEKEISSNDNDTTNNDSFI